MKDSAKVFAVVLDRLRFSGGDHLRYVTGVTSGIRAASGADTLRTASFPAFASYTVFSDVFWLVAERGLGKPKAVHGAVLRFGLEPIGGRFSNFAESAP